MSFAVNQDLLQDEGDPEVLPVGVYLDGEPVPADRTLLFGVNGKQYTAPKKVPKKVVFRYLRALHNDEGEKAMADMVYEVLGDAVMDALATEDLHDDEFDQVMRVVRKHVMGATEATLGNSSNGRRR